MKRFIGLLILVALTILLLNSSAMVMSKENIAQQPICASHCLAATQNFDVKAPTNEPFTLLALVVAISFLPLLFLENFSSFPLRQIRSSPNLIKLYSQFLN